MGNFTDRPGGEIPLPAPPAFPIKAAPEEVAAMLQEVRTNRPIIQDFLDTMGAQGAFMFSAFLVGSLAAQDPGIIHEHARAVNVAVQCAGAMLAQYKLENPGWEPAADDPPLILFPDLTDPGAVKDNPHQEILPGIIDGLSTPSFLTPDTSVC